MASPTNVINQLGLMGVLFNKMDPQIRDQLFQHLSDPKTKAKIARRAKDWSVPEHDAAMTSAVLFLHKNNAIEDDVAAMLHMRLSKHMESVHKAGGVKGKLSRSLAALRRLQRMRGGGRRRMGKAA